MMRDGFAEWGVIISKKIKYTEQDFTRIRKVLNNSNAYFDMAHQHKQLLGPEWTVPIVTQSASDACNMLLGEVSDGGCLIVEDGGYHACRGLLTLYGPYQNNRKRHRKSMIETCHIPRRGARKMMNILTSETAYEGDDEALLRLNEMMRPGSVCLVQTITNSIWNGCASGYFLRKLREMTIAKKSLLVVDETLTAIRTGKLWSFEHVSDFTPDRIIFGKAFGTCGIAIPAASLMDVYDCTTPIHPCALIMTQKIMRSIRAWLASRKKYTQFEAARAFVEAEFKNVQGIGLLFASHCSDTDPFYTTEELYRNNNTANCAFSQLDNIMRCTFTIDEF